MNEKPKKRLVGWTQYVRIAGRGTALKLSGATLVGIAGVSSLLSCLMLFFCLSTWMMWRHEQWDQDIMDWVRGTGVLGTFFGVSGIASLIGAVKVWKEAQKVESVILLTKHNIANLPAVETLVRPSDLPHSHQQAELLRGVGPPLYETPPEELLRATLKSTNDED
ncbi:MAG: hypothetical protein JWN14_4110 [Chthonomonadales bacterium]|nr:hypothetical protein [Chthonomonadales bacterium]